MRSSFLLALTWGAVMFATMSQVATNALDITMPESEVAAERRDLQATGSYCNNFDFPIAPCADPRPRDVMFLIDASDSMERTRFYTSMLDYALALFCAFDASANNRVGMVLFNRDIKLAIPMARYNRNQWLQKVNEIRNSEESCCSCCTPTAEAFDMAAEEFTQRGVNSEKLTVIVTDGEPVNNDIGGNPLWRWQSAKLGFSPTTYNYDVVPDRAASLKALGVRLMLVGVPSKVGTPPNLDYFRGIPQKSRRDPSKPTFRLTQCIYRPPANPGKKKWCGRMERNFPIVSEPVIENSFAAVNWDVGKLVQQTVGSLCIITQPPTVSIPPTTPVPTTKAPTTAAPTFGPTKAPNPYDVSQLDMHVILDRSGSMVYKGRNNDCNKVLKGLPALPGKKARSACWDLSIRFTIRLAQAIANIDGKSGKLGWGSEFEQDENRPARGLRIWVWGFSCAKHQTVPLSFLWVNGTASYAEFEERMHKIRVNVYPQGGTCPGQTVENVIKAIEASPEKRYPNQVGIIFTDGVSYDKNALEKAVPGLKAYGMTRYAIGIAVPGKGSNYGLTKKEVKKQKEQLLNFVGGDEASVFTLGKDGLSALPEIAQSIADNVPLNLQYNPIVTPRYKWCGWRLLNGGCKSNNFRNENCQWKGKNTAQFKCSLKEGA